MSKKNPTPKPTTDNWHKEPVIVEHDQPSKELIYQQKTHAGPLPTPEDLQKYEMIMPGAAERIFSYAEREQSQRHDIEKDAVKIEADKVGAIKVGIICGYIVNAICIIVAGICACTGYPIGISVGAYPLISYLIRWLTKKPETEDGTSK